MKVIALKPEESETLERAFYEADSYERLISVLGRHLNAEASADAKDIIMHYAEPCRASQMKLKWCRIRLFLAIRSMWMKLKDSGSILPEEVHLLDP